VFVAYAELYFIMLHINLQSITLHCNNCAL